MRQIFLLPMAASTAPGDGSVLTSHDEFYVLTVTLYVSICTAVCVIARDFVLCSISFSF